MTLFKLLQEAKDHIIKKLPNLQDKEKIIKFFQENPAAESLVDWNNTKKLDDKFFNTFIFNYNRNNKTQLKKNSKKGVISDAFKEGEDYYDVSNPSQDLYLFIPLTYEFQKYIQNLGGEDVAAEWCLGYQRTDSYWKDSVRDNCTFLIVISKDLKQKLAFQYCFDKFRRVWGIKDTDFFLKDKPYMIDLVEYEGQTMTLLEASKAARPDDTYTDFAKCFEENGMNSNITKRAKEEDIKYFRKKGYKLSKRLATDQECDDHSMPRNSELELAKTIDHKKAIKLYLSKSSKKGISFKDYFYERLEEIGGSFVKPLISNDYKNGIIISHHFCLNDLIADYKILEGLTSNSNPIKFFQEMKYMLDAYKLPENLDNTPVKKIHKVSSKLPFKKIIIPKIYKRIDDRAFDSCLAEEIIFEGDDFTKIGYCAFIGCKNLKEIKLPKNLKTLGENAFALCENLERIYISKETKIKEWEENPYTDEEKDKFIYY